MSKNVNMSQAVAQSVCQYTSLSTAIRQAATRVIDRQVGKGNERQDAIMFSVGYMESALASLLATLPKTRQAAFIEELNQIARV
jgi:hypothetical protein